MAQLFGLSGEGGQVDGIRPLFPKERGGKWVDAPAAYNPHKTLYNRCRRWSDKGVFDLIFSELSASDAAEPRGADDWRH